MSEQEKEILLTSSAADSELIKPNIQVDVISPFPSPKTISPQYTTSNKPPLYTPPTDDDLPTNVCTEEQLASLPSVCLSGIKERPLRHVNERGEASHYALQPMFYSVIFILLVELLERFSFYGINYTQTSFLTGAYDENWNAGMAVVQASSFVSISTAVAYTMPFLGAYLADSLLGDFWSVLFGSLLLYLPGLLLILLSTIPHVLGETFNKGLLSLGLLVLWPTGTGIVKSIINVFGAKQYHPLLQSSLIQSYYVNFYMCINIGALIGGIVVPIVAQYDVTLAYTYPVAMLGIGLLLFVLGSPRYIRQKPSGDLFAKAAPGSDSKIGLFTIFKISILTVPFSIAYSQMATTFIVQGTVMEKFGFLDAAGMNNADAISVLAFGYVIGAMIYPALARRDIKIPTAYKFAIGSALGALSIGWALFMEYKIAAEYEATGGKVSILWQSWAYVFIGAGEIFAISSAYEVAFTAAPPEKKVLASAVNLFCVGGIPNVLCIILYNICEPWFRNSHGTNRISRLEDYVSANVDKYFWVLLWIALLGVFVNILPPVRDFVASVEEEATDNIKTPVLQKRPTRHRRRQSGGSDYSSGDEESPLLQVHRHQAYLKYGSGPVLHKQGSMRAGPYLAKGKSSPKTHIKRAAIDILYRAKSTTKPPREVVLGAGGKPLTAGKIYRQGRTP
jgi:POT family proton-dependent oligopeptide transporter